MTPGLSLKGGGSDIHIGGEHVYWLIYYLADGENIKQGKHGFYWEPETVKMLGTERPVVCC